MSSGVGEAQGGPGRFFGGPSRLELFKRWYAAVNPANVQIGEHPAVLIDAVGEVAHMGFVVPPNYSTLEAFTLRVVSAQAGVNVMNFLATIDIGGFGQAYNFHPGVATQRQATVTLNQMDGVEIWQALPAVMTIDDIVGVEIAYRAAGGGGIATNAYILGAILEWR
jgi:hypothetical protein